MIAFFLACVPPTALDVFPCLSLHDVRDGRWSDSELLSKAVHRRAFRVQASNFANSLVCQFAIAATFAVGVAVFLQHVLVVLVSRAEKQVRWVHAVANVAVVADPHSGRDRTIVYFPRRSVRHVVALLSARPVWSDSPVSILSMGACPQPTRSRLFDVSPEAFSHGNASVNQHRWVTTVDTCWHTQMITAQEERHTQKPIAFRLICIPPTASHHQKRIVRFKVRGELVSRLADKPALTDAKQTIDTLLLAHQPPAPLAGPVSLLLEFTWPWRSSDSQRRRARGRVWRDTQPDCSNLAKTTEDRLVAMRFLENDARVVELIVRKYFGDKPGIGVAITPLSDEQHRPGVHEHARVSTGIPETLFDFREEPTA